MVLAERLRRAQCLSRSGATPSKARAPSNTLDASQKPWVRAPTIGALPSSHSPSRKVKVCDQAGMSVSSKRRFTGTCLVQNRHREERSDVAIQEPLGARRSLDGFAPF